MLVCKKAEKRGDVEETKRKIKRSPRVVGASCNGSFSTIVIAAEKKSRASEQK